MLGDDARWLSWPCNKPQSPPELLRDDERQAWAILNRNEPPAVTYLSQRGKHGDLPGGQ
jgi:hypothetical protein